MCYTLKRRALARPHSVRAGEQALENEAAWRASSAVFRSSDRSIGGPATTSRIAITTAPTSIHGKADASRPMRPRTSRITTRAEIALVREQT